MKLADFKGIFNCPVALIDDVMYEEVFRGRFDRIPDKYLNYFVVSVGDSLSVNVSYAYSKKFKHEKFTVYLNIVIVSEESYLYEE